MAKTASKTRRAPRKGVTKQKRKPLSRRAASVRRKASGKRRGSASRRRAA